MAFVEKLKKVLTFFYDRIYERVIKPVLISASPLEEVALGMGIGMFVGLTPTVGIQMWIVFTIWLILKYTMGIRFDVFIGTAVVWISNPFTMFFLYYGFLVTGVSFLSSIGFDVVDLNFSVFYEQFSGILNNPDSSSMDVIVEGSKFLLVELGWPMLIGSFFYAIPISILSYFITKKLLYRYRCYKASQMGLDYQTWRRKFERAKLPKRSGLGKKLKD